jgi:outer membrane protein
MDVGVSSLAKEIKDSPLVDRSTENRVFIGYLYSF